MKVEQDLIKGTVRMSQEKYCNDVLKRFYWMPRSSNHGLSMDTTHTHT